MRGVRGAATLVEDNDETLGQLQRLHELRKSKRERQALQYRVSWRCDRQECDGQPHDQWEAHARSSQVVPISARTSYVVGGRGSGKTKAGAWNAADAILRTPPDPGDDHTEWAVIAPTYKDARDVCMEGPSGLIRALGGHHGGVDDLILRWDRSFGKLVLATGAVVWVDAANEGALRIQGKNLYGGWFDEVGLWRNWRTAWEESIGFAVRKGQGVRICTGTPKQNSLAKILLKDSTVWKRRLRTLDNMANLSTDVVDALVAKYEGTRLGRQELEGELLDDVEGALWLLTQIDGQRVDPAEQPERFDRVVVAIDPAVTNTETSDETGIVVAGLVGKPDRGELYVLQDLSGRYSPSQWASVAISAYERWGADRVVAEVNNGGDMVEHVLRSVQTGISYRKVHASRGKITRAEPIAAIYEQGRAHHVGVHPQLEDQMTSWVPQNSDISPDRLDALVWAATDLTQARKARIVVYDQPRRSA